MKEIEHAPPAKKIKYKKFMLVTKSESCDDYSYLLKHPTMPTSEELDMFLQENACDQDEGRHYENVVDIIELSGKYLTIPQK